MMLIQQPTDGDVLECLPLGRRPALGGAHHLEPADHKALRSVAAGLCPTPADPSLRRWAIENLGRLRTVEDLNMLATLARSDRELEVRVTALLSLAGTGLAMAAPVLRDALLSGDAEERDAAEQGLVRLARDIGDRAVLDAIRPPVGVGRVVRSVEPLLSRARRRYTATKPCRAPSDPM